MSSKDDQLSQERQSLLSKLLDAVKQCQIRFGGRTELATENDSRVVCLCTQLENVLQHGIRKNVKGMNRLKYNVTEVIKGLSLLNAEGEPVFWHFVRTALNKHEYERYMLLKNIYSDIGRGRAWLRSALNERSLERYFHMLLSDTNQINQFYEDSAFMMDEERSSMLPMMAAGLGSILFAIGIDNPDLNNYKSSSSESVAEISKNSSSEQFNSFEPEPVVAKSSESHRTGKKSKRKKKWPTPQVISFDDNEMCQNCSRSPDHHCQCNSAPATCLSSPVTTNFSDLPSVQLESDLENIPFIDSAAGSSKKPNIPSTVNCISPYDGNTFLNASHPKKYYSSENISNSESGRMENSSPVPVPAIVNGHQDDQRNGLDVGEKRSQMLSSSTSSTTSFPPNPGDQSLHIHATLTPIDDASVGELIPVGQNEDVASSAEDSVSIPSFCDDVDNAAAALAIAQRAPSWSISSLAAHNSRKTSECRSRSDTQTMNADELREAILAVLQKKEESEEKNRVLRSLLDREMEMTAGLRAEMEDIQKHNTDKMEKSEAKIQAVTRENELLKHQLRKYITAVQMLKHDSSKISELAAVVGEIQPAIPEPKIYIDHQYEASEYEKKLVQVAEMHGELMEFNERLHRLLLQREVTIRRLREELVDLRGPLPDDNQTSDDDVSITSDYDASSQTTPLRPLINVWIPSAFLTGRAADSHHVYQIYVRIRDDEWNIYRRYAQFYALHKMLKKKDPIVGTFDFPPKKTIGKKDAKVVEQRRRRLQHYLRCVLNWLLQNNAELGNAPDKETFISYMPFFGDQGHERRRQGTISGGNSRLCLPGMSSSPSSQQQQQPVQHYTGL